MSLLICLILFTFPSVIPSLIEYVAAFITVSRSVLSDDINLFIQLSLYLQLKRFIKHRAFRFVLYLLHYKVSIIKTNNFSVIPHTNIDRSAIWSMDSQTVSPSKVVSILVKPSSVWYIIISEFISALLTRFSVL